MTLRARLYAIAIVLVATSVGLSVALYRSVRSMRSDYLALELSTSQHEAMAILASDLQHMALATPDAAPRADVDARELEEMLEQVRMRTDDLEHATADEAERGESEEDEAAEWDAIRSGVDSLEQAVRVVASGARAGVDASGLEPLSRTVRASAESLRGTIASALERESEERARRAAEVSDQVRRLTLLSIGAPLAAFGIVSLLLILVVRRLNSGLSRLIAGAERIGAGELDVRIEDDASDELSVVFRAFSGMSRELKESRRSMLDASRRAGMAEVAAGVLHNVGNVLNNLNVSAVLLSDRVKSSRVASVTMTGRLLEEKSDGVGDFIASDRRGKTIPAFLTTLGNTLEKERLEILDEIASLSGDIDHIKKIVSAQQANARSDPLLDRVEVWSVVDDALRMTALEAQGVDVSRSGNDVTDAMVDRHEVLQILTNVLTNARHAIQQTGRTDQRVHVDVARSQGRIRLSVRDNGVGVAPGNLTRIFQHGFTTKPHGHGFGLHASANTARLLGGSLTCASDGPDRGATFTLEIPAVGRAKAA
jgi:signal transduction histidine kinase